MNRSEKIAKEIMNNWGTTIPLPPPKLTKTEIHQSATSNSALRECSIFGDSVQLPATIKELNSNHCKSSYSHFSMHALRSGCNLDQLMWKEN